MPKETREGERRVALVPDTVSKLAALGLDVTVSRMLELRLSRPTPTTPLRVQPSWSQALLQRPSQMLMSSPPCVR